MASIDTPKLPTPPLITASKKQLQAVDKDDEVAKSIANMLLRMADGQPEPDPPNANTHTRKNPPYKKRTHTLRRSRAAELYDPLTITDPDVRNRDDSLGEEDYLKVYEAFSRTGDTTELAKATGLHKFKVDHLLNLGIHRLGLPPIREHATDLVAVNRKLKEGLNKHDQTYTQTAIQKLPDFQEQITERATREATAATSLLAIATNASTIIRQYVDTLLEGIQAGEVPLAIPEDGITPNYLVQLTKAISSLTTAIDSSVRLSRLTAGEPEQNLSLQITHLVGQFTADELRAFAEGTGDVPSRLRLGSGRVQSGTGHNHKPSVIDAVLTAAQNIEEK